MLLWETNQKVFPVTAEHVSVLFLAESSSHSVRTFLALTEILRVSAELFVLECSLLRSSVLPSCVVKDVFLLKPSTRAAARSSLTELSLKWRKREEKKTFPEPTASAPLDPFLRCVFNLPNETASSESHESPLRVYTFSQISKHPRPSFSPFVSLTFRVVSGVFNSQHVLSLINVLLRLNQNCSGVEPCRTQMSSGVVSIDICTCVFFFTSFLSIPRNLAA